MLDPSRRLHVDSTSSKQWKNELLVFFFNNPRSKSLALEAKVKRLHLQEHVSYLIEIVTCGGNSTSISQIACRDGFQRWHHWLNLLQEVNGRFKKGALYMWTWTNRNTCTLLSSNSQQFTESAVYHLWLNHCFGLNQNISHKSLKSAAWTDIRSQPGITTYFGRACFIFCLWGMREAAPAKCQRGY